MSFKTYSTDFILKNMISFLWGPESQSGLWCNTAHLGEECIFLDASMLMVKDKALRHRVDFWVVLCGAGSWT